MIATETVSWGQFRREISFRSSSTDAGVIGDVFRRGAYNLRDLRSRGDEINAMLKRHALLEERPLIVDAGGNIGAAAVYFAMVYPIARIVSIEPDPRNFELLVKNTEGLDVRCLNGAVSSQPGAARVIDTGLGYSGLRTERFSGQEPGIPCYTVNQILMEESSNKIWPFLVKIDIEGSEGDLFQGNTEWVAQTPVILIELHDWLLPKAGTARPFFRCMADQDRDFQCLSHNENYVSIRNELE
ncbi:MAG: FkbM family methyltransferase [Fimbriimonas ginsengisoli]|uniref:FkbM family methyltransferase n=1 Tax=Fimbriimonas ginsengisoli TaxID=1005039 RepID=A0A931PWV1_FIMGI|nr:FkbM family methyltransferase [Fimbriimonas ginsengisoli]MBI3722109.1 FkbM family methyltransferase [Fimbriimonas ginsengisoli]